MNAISANSWINELGIYSQKWCNKQTAFISFLKKELLDPRTPNRFLIDMCNHLRLVPTPISPY